MKLAVMPTAKRHSEFIAHLAAECYRLGKTKMMRVARLPSADEAGLRSDKPQMRAVTIATRLAER